MSTVLTVLLDVIGYYQTTMYNALGIEGHRAVLVAGIYNCIGPIANLIFIFFILDRVGRKKPLLVGAFAITLALFAEAGLNAANPDSTRTAYSIGGVFFLFLGAPLDYKTSTFEHFGLTFLQSRSFSPSRSAPSAGCT
jgi:MFS family permease